MPRPILLLMALAMSVCCAREADAADWLIGAPRVFAALVLYVAIGFGVGFGVRLARRAPARLVAIVVSVALVAVGFEAFLRHRAGPEGLHAFEGVPSPHYHHTPPRARKMFAGRYEGVPIVVETNEDGLRTPYTRADFRSHGPRIAVLGDSFVFGFLVPEPAALPRRLEEILRVGPGGERTAVLNAGIISFSPLLHGKLFEGIVRHYAPEIVVMVLDASDIGDDYDYARQLVIRDGVSVFDVPEPEPSGEYGRVAELLRPVARLGLHPIAAPRPRAAGDYSRFSLEIGGIEETNRFFIYRHPLEETRAYFEATLGQIEAVARAVHATGARFALVVSPRFHHWNPKESPDNWESDLYRVDEPYQFELFRFFEAAGERVDFPIHSLLEDFRETREFPLVFRRDPHWNAGGHAFAARAIARFLREQGWVR